MCGEWAGLRPGLQSAGPAVRLQGGPCPPGGQVGLPVTLSSASDHPACATATALLACFLFDSREEGPEFYCLVLRSAFHCFKILILHWNPCILGVGNKGKSMKWPFQGLVPCYCWGSCYSRVHCSLSFPRPGFGCLDSPGLGLNLEAHTSSRSHRPGDSVGSCEPWDRAPVPCISDKFLFSFSDLVAIVKETLQSWMEWRKEAALLCFLERNALQQFSPAMLWFLLLLSSWEEWFPPLSTLFVIYKWRTCHSYPGPCF